MKAIKLLLKLLVTLVLVIVIVAVAVLVIVDPNDYRPDIMRQVKQATGRDLNIAGDIDLSLFPWVGISLGRVALANAEGFSMKPFARIDQLDVKVKLLPLLRQEVEVDKVRLHGLFASLEINDQGVGNWQDLAGPAEAKEAEPATLADQADAQTHASPYAEPAAQASPLAALAINGIEIIDAEVHWTDASSGTESALRGLNLTTSAIRFDEPVDIAFSAHVSHNQPPAEVDIRLAMALTINEALDRIRAERMRLETDADAPEVFPQRIALVLSADVDADLAQQTVSLAKVSLASAGVEMRADLRVTALNTAPAVEGQWHTMPFNAREVAKRFGVELPPMAGEGRLENVALASVLSVATSPVIQARLDDFVVDIDESRLTGFVHVLDAAKPALRYQLHLTTIDADVYLPPPADEPVSPIPPVESTGPAPDPEIVLPVELLRGLDLEGEIRMDSVTITQLPVTDILVKTVAKDGVVNINPVTMKLLDGSVNAAVTVNAANTRPAYSLALRASELNAGPVVNPVLAGLKGDESISMDGRLRLVADIATQGTLLSQLKQSAKGRVEFDMGKTTLAGVDLEYVARNAVADYLVTKSLDVPSDWRGSYSPETKTAFDLMHASADVAVGKVTNRDMRLEGKRLRVKGEGEFNILNNTMDYRIVVDLDPLRTQTTAEKLLDQPVGLHITGPFAQPSVSIDNAALKQALGSLLEAETKARLQKELDEEKAKLEEKARQKKEELQRKADQEKLELKQKADQEKQEAVDKLKNKLKGLF